MVNEKINFELNKLKILYEYWATAERTELIVLVILFNAFLIPLLIHIDFDLSKIGNWIYLIVGYIILIGVRMNYYISKQKEIRLKIEKLKF